MVRQFGGRGPSPGSRLSCSGTFALLITIILSTRTASGDIGLTAGSLFGVTSAPRGVLRLNRRGLAGCVGSVNLCEGGTGGMVKLDGVLLRSFGNVIPSSVRGLMGLPKIKEGATGIILGIVFGGPAVPMSARLLHMDPGVNLTRKAAPRRIRRSLLGEVPTRCVRGTRR